MCGIFGQITPEKPVDPRRCYAATEALSHRGPDGLGIALGRLADRKAAFLLNPPAEALRAGPQDADFFLGHRRLCVVDLTPQAFQPMPNEDETIWLVFNGEIYNHRSLRDHLTGCGHRFRTHHCDTEVLVHGYEQWGSGVVDRLRGMFALAVLDLRERTLFLARDRFGEKPLYYAWDHAGVRFASQLSALLHLPEPDPALSPLALIDYLNHGFVPAPRSIYRHVHKLRAAERVSIRLDAPRTAAPDTYWTPRYEPTPGRSAAEWFEEFQAELEESIRLRMMADVPLGCFLSGGLDSTIVARQMSLASGRPLKTFSIGFREKRFDESAYAVRAARAYGTAHRSEVLSPDEMLKAVGPVGRVFDEPFADSSAIATYLVSRLARQEVTVALSGDGGDELLAGYRRYRLQQRLSRVLDRQPSFLAKLVLEPIASFWPERSRGKSLLSLLVSGAKTRYFKVFLDDYLVHLARRELAQQWDCLLEPAWPDHLPHLVDRMCAADCRFYIPEDLMVKVDRASMGVSLEARCPLLDHKLFELVGRMPLRTRFDAMAAKLPFRRILAAELGPEFVRRPKKGFSVPLGEWFRGALHEELSDVLLRTDGLVVSLFSRGTIRKLIEDHCKGSRDQSHRLWKLYMLQRWDDNFGHGRAAHRRPAVPAACPA